MPTQTGAISSKKGMDSGIHKLYLCLPKSQFPADLDRLTQILDDPTDEMSQMTVTAMHYSLMHVPDGNPHTSRLKYLLQCVESINTIGVNGDDELDPYSYIVEDLRTSYCPSISRWSKQDVMLLELVRSFEAHALVQAVYTRRYRQEWHVHVLLSGGRLSRNLIDEMLEIEYAMRTLYSGTVFDFSYYPTGNDGEASALEPSAIRLFQR